jgi:formylglycine-generating enzyme required for sulfatase activity
MHLEAPIPSLCQARPETPEALDAVCQRMLAKKPEDRYQSMAEVAAELEAVLAVLSGGSATATAASDESPSEVVARTFAFLQEVTPRDALTRQKKPTATERTEPHVGPEQGGKGVRSNLPDQPSVGARPKGASHKLDLTPFPLLGKFKRAVGMARRKPLLLLGVGIGLVLLLAVVLVLSLRQGTLVVEIDEQLGKDVQVAVSQGGEKVQVADARSGWTLSLGAGKYDLAVQGGDDQFQLDPQSVTVTHGGQVKVKVTLKPAVAPFDAKQARAYQDRWARQLGVPVEITNSIGMKLVLIPPGEFMMGSPKELIEEELNAHADDPWWYRGHLLGEGPKHRVRITQPFYLGMCEVTQGEYQRVVGTNPSEFSAMGKSKDKVAGQNTKRFPVECVTWADAVEFCRKLSGMPEETAARRWYGLPSEAQWEYACRAGSTGRFTFSSGRTGIPREYEEQELSDYGWFKGNAGGMPRAVGLKRASAWGLYDVQGNVCEWCGDWYENDYYAKSPADDPTGPPGGSYRVVRGGSWIYRAGICRSAHRGYHASSERQIDVGFRASLVLPDTAAERAKPPPELKSQISDLKSQTPDLKSQISNPEPSSPPPAVAPFDAAKAKEHQENWAKHLGVPVETANSIGMKLVLIPPGEFTMGSPKELIEEELKRPGIEDWYKDHLRGEGPQHRVRITKPFYLGVYEVTQGEYEQVIGKNPGSFSATGKSKDKVAGQDTKRFPVESVSWDEAVEFCRKLSELPEEKAAGRWYRLPSEAQWEYACRAGSTGRYSFSPINRAILGEHDEHGLGDYGWFKGNSGGMAEAVGGKRPSVWGLYDMHGSVWEWCQDWYDEAYYGDSPIDDPGGPPGGSHRVARGGGWYDPASDCRSAVRGNNVPGNRNYNQGFRASLVFADTAVSDLKSQIPDLKSQIPNPESSSAPPKVPSLERPKPPVKKEAKPEIAPSPAAEKPKRLPPPSAEVQQEIAAQVEDAYKLADARKPEEQIKLAKDLVRVAEKAAKPQEQFVLLRKAAELACKADDAATMFQAVDRLGQRFELDALAVKEKMLAKLAAGGVGAARIKFLVESSNALIDQALAEERFDAALDLANAVSHACLKREGAPFRKQALARRKEIQERQQEAEKIGQALETVRANPQDAEANLTVGKLYCFAKEDWAKGLPYLARGTDEDLKTLALQETGSPPGDDSGEVKLADAWWSVGQSARAKARGAISLHVGTWYQQASLSLPAGVVKARVEKRLEEIAVLGREIPLVPGRRPPPALAPFDEKMAGRYQKLWSQHLHAPVVQTNSIGMKLVLIPPGEFQMGSPKELIQEELKAHGDDHFYKDHLLSEGPQHRVRITRPFYFGVYLVTQEEYQRVTGKNPSAYSATGGNDAVSGMDTKRLPVERVSWEDAVEFCRKLSEMPEEKAAGRTYRLPSEAQWEYACRAGSTGRYSFSLGGAGISKESEEHKLSDYGWFGNSPHAVGGKRPNAWGLYDMHGNVWEYCQDWYDKAYYANAPADDPAGPLGGERHVFRGGCFNAPARYARSAFRFRDVGPGPRVYNLGFRAALVLPDK